MAYPHWPPWTARGKPPTKVIPTGASRAAISLCASRCASAQCLFFYLPGGFRRARGNSRFNGVSSTARRGPVLHLVTWKHTPRGGRDH